MQDARDECPGVEPRLLLHFLELTHPEQSPVCGATRLQQYHALLLLHTELLNDSLRKAQEWRFFDSTTTIASEWTQTAFDDSNWNVAVRVNKQTNKQTCLLNHGRLPLRVVTLPMLYA